MPQWHQCVEELVLWISGWYPEVTELLIMCWWAARGDVIIFMLGNPERHQGAGRETRFHDTEMRWYAALSIFQTFFVWKSVHPSPLLQFLLKKGNFCFTGVHLAEIYFLPCSKLVFFFFSFWSTIHLIYFRFSHSHSAHIPATPSCPHLFFFLSWLKCQRQFVDLRQQWMPEKSLWQQQNCRKIKKKRDAF